jgi:hypothetical protein
MREHPKVVGDRSTLAIMTALQAAGYGLYLPFGENTRCDLILQRDDGLLRVQCKTGRLREGAIRFAVCSSYGHHRNPSTVRRDYRGEIDLFAVFCPETQGVYLVPIGDVPFRSTAYLRVTTPKNNQHRSVRLAIAYEVGRVSIEGLRAPSGA